MRLQPWFAWTLALGCLGWQLVARVGVYLSMLVEQSRWSFATAATGAAAIAALAGVLALIMLGRGPRRLLLALLVPLTLVPFAVGGLAAPIGLGGLLAAAVLLAVRAPRSWLLFGAVVTAEASLGGWVEDGDLFAAAHRTLIAVIIGMTLFAVTRLAQLVTAADDARQQLARAEANAERLRAAGRLNAGLGAQLSGVIQRTRDAVTAPAPSREALAEIAELAHRATTAARQVAAARTAPGRPPPAPATPTYAFAWWVSVVLIVSYAGFPLVIVYGSGSADPAPWAVLVGVAVTAGALQLYHGTPRLGGQDPPGWRWTIAAQASLVFVATVVVRAEEVLVLWYLMTGTIITRARRAWAWLVVPGLLVGYGATAYATGSYWDGWSAVCFAGTLSIAIISVYALCELPVTAERLHRSRADLARTAIAAERLRFARDVHDLLGFHLAAIALKTELAARALDTALAETRQQLREVQRSAEQALTEIRSISGVAEEITSQAELTAARSLLAAAQVQVSVDAPATPAPDVDHLVGIIIREGATNVVRHARAQHCSIQVEIGASTVRVVVTNDGVSGAARAGTGLANLRSRVEAAGGELTASATGDTFTLAARLPVRAPLEHLQTAP